jgi:hypothetical protein
MSKHAVWEDLVSVGRRHRRETAKTRKGTERQQSRESLAEATYR